MAEHIVTDADMKRGYTEYADPDTGQTVRVKIKAVEGTVVEKDEGKTERYEMPKRIDRLEKTVRELAKQRREDRKMMREAFELMAAQSAGVFGQGNLASGFRAIVEGLKDG